MPTRRKRSEMNRKAVFNDTCGPLPSKPFISPLHGVLSWHEDMDRHRSTYAQYHGPKVVYHNSRVDIASKPSSLRLLVGTNDTAEDLTGQRLPLNAFSWKSETKANFDGKVHRPRSAPTFRREISMMNNEGPLFGKTLPFSSSADQASLHVSDLNPHQTVAPSEFRGRDTYQTTYSFTHRPFDRDERMASHFWGKEKDTYRPWLQGPAISALKPQLQVPQTRLATATSANKVYPNDAQLATLPHFLDPNVRTGRSEVQEEYTNPYRAPDFYFEEPNKLKKPVSMHLEKTFIA